MIQDEDRTDDAPILGCENLTRIYENGHVLALDDVSVAFQRGDLVSVMGPSGCGKTTLLNILGTLDRPTSGSVFIDGQRLSPGADLDGIRSRKIGFVFQAFHLLPTMTAIENVQVPMFESDLSPRQRREKAGGLLETVGIGARRNHLPTQLSGGERQRVAIARALANDPVILLADEPTGNLDSRTGAEVLEMFLRLHRERRLTVVVVTHSPEVSEATHRRIRMLDGRIISDELADRKVAEREAVR